MLKSPLEGVIALPKAVLNHLYTASAEELKTLIYFFANPEASISEAARDTGMTAAQVETATAFWRGAGVFQEGEANKKNVAKDASIYRNYDSDTLSKALEEGSEFAMLCEHAGQKLGKQLNKNDYSSLFYLYDFVGMPAPVIYGVIEQCCSEGKTGLQYIFKKTVGLYDDGIDTYDKFEAYLARRAVIGSNISRLRKLCGMGDRELTAKEKKLFDTWFGDWNIAFELVRLAYEKTVDNTGKLSFSYMNSILKRWFESGYSTVDDVANGEASRKEETGNSSFSEDEFIEAALKRGLEE